MVGKKETRKYDFSWFFIYLFFFVFFFIAREPVVLQHGRGQQNHDQRFRSVQDRGLRRDGHGLRNSRIRRYVTVLCSVFKLLNRQNEEIAVRVDSKIYGIFFFPLVRRSNWKNQNKNSCLRGTFWIPTVSFSSLIETVFSSSTSVNI